MKILLVRQDKLGDLLLTTPLLRALSRVGTVDLWARREWREVWERLSFVRGSETTYRLGLRGILRAAQQMRGFDAVVLPKEDSGDHTVAARLAGVPIRVGETQKGYGKFLTHRPSLPEEAHEVDRLFVLGSVLGELGLPGGLEFPVPSGERHGALVVAPGGGGTTPRYGRYREVLEGWDGPVVLTGGAGDLEAGNGLPGDNRIGKLSLAETASLMAGARAVLATNSGAVHLAASQGTPVCVIETSDRPDYFARRWGPWKTAGAHAFAAAGESEPSPEAVLTSLRSLPERYP